MPSDLLDLIKKYHAFYEISPYQVLVEHHGSPGGSKQLIQSGFDVDVHGVSKTDEVNIPPADEYASGYAALKEKMAETFSRHARECDIEVIAFPSTAFSEPSRPRQSEAIIRIRISHRGGAQPVGLPEQHALQEVEKQLRSLGIARR
jgi:hypothetical protein